MTWPGQSFQEPARVRESGEKVDLAYDARTLSNISQGCQAARGGSEMECWSVGVLEYWVLMHHSITPSLQSPGLLVHVAPGVIRAAHEGTGFDVAETKLLGFELELLEFLRRYIAIDAKLAIRWL